MLHLPHGIIMSQTCGPFQNDIQIHQRLCLPRKITSKNHLSFWPRPANVLDVLATSRSATPATWMKKCPMSCACHAKRRSRPQTPATQNGHSSKNEHGDLRKRQNRTAHLVRAGAVEMHMDISVSQGNFCARIYGEKAKDLMMMKHPDLTPALYPYRKNLSVWTHCLGNNQPLQGNAAGIPWHLRTPASCRLADPVLAVAHNLPIQSASQ